MAAENLVNVLLVEDSATTTELVKLWLEDGLSTPYDLTTTTSLADGIQALTAAETNVVVLDLNLPDSEGLSSFAQMHRAAPDIPIVIMSGESDESIAVEAVRQGAQDYVVKSSYDDVNPLIRPLLFAIERSARQRAERQLESTQHQVWLASRVQQQLFPPVDTKIKGFDVAGRCTPAESAGGDYYDFIPMLDGNWGIVIGDVSGHGLASSLFMVSVRAVLRALVVSYQDTGLITTHINRVLEPDFHDGRFVTFLFLCLSPADHTLQFASAGHPGYILDVQGEVRTVLEADTPPIGIVSGQHYDTSDEMIHPGEILVLCTDGVTECHNSQDEMFGLQRLLEVIRKHRRNSAQAIIDAIFDELHDFADGIPQLDDITAVIVKCEN